MLLAFYTYGVHTMTAVALCEVKQSPNSQHAQPVYQVDSDAAGYRDHAVGSLLIGPYSGYGMLLQCGHLNWLFCGPWP